MSLINQMLQDLDARRAAHGVGANLPNDVRPLPVARPSRWPWVLGAGILAALLAAGALFLLWQARPAMTAPVAQQARPAAPPVPAETASVPADVRVSPAPPVDSPLQALDGSLRLAEYPTKAPEDRKAAPKPDSSIPVAEKPATGPRKPEGERGLTETMPAPRVDKPKAALAGPPPQEGRAGKAPVIEKTEASAGSPHERAEAEYRKAIAAVNQGRVGEAMDGLQGVLRTDGLHAASRQLLVRLLLEAKKTDEAARVLQEGLQGQPAQIGWAMSLARLQMDRGDLGGAWKTLDFSLPAAGRNADYQGFAGHVLQRLGRNGEAAERYGAAARLSPGDGRWWLGLGLAFDAEGRSTEARDAFLRARQSGNLGPDLQALVEQKLR